MTATITEIQIEFRLIVSVAATLTLVSFAFLTVLLGKRSDPFHRAALCYGGCLIGLLCAVVSVLLTEHLPFAASAACIIAGAHLAIILAYLGFREALGAPLPARPILGMAALICLAQGFLALATGDVGLLMLTSSLVNGLLGLMGCADILRLGSRHRRPARLLPALPFALPFALVGFAYLARLVLLLTGASAAELLTMTALIAFALGIASMTWGFALILLREAFLKNQLAESRQKAEAMVKQRTRFFAQMSHEIRTPLNGILGLTEILAPHVRGQEGRKLLADLRSSGSLLMSIVNEMLDFSKAEAGRIELESLPINLPTLIRTIASQYQAIGASKGVDVNVDIRPTIFPTVLGDPTRLNQILQNLLGNAMKFTSSGSIHVELVHDSQGAVALSVRDTGIGMTEAQIETLFMPFQQAAADTARHFGGTGLGMSIVKMLVDAMDGAILVESRPGRGTCVSVRLPLHAAPLAPPPEPEEPVSTTKMATAGHLRILCADDDHINRLVLQAMLETYGIDPVMAEDGHDAVRRAAGNRFDAWLIDISMPGMDGLETLATLRERYGNGADPPPLAVAVTANVLAEDVGSYLAAGFDRHLPKPISRPELEAALHAIHAHAEKTRKSALADAVAP